MTHPQKILVDSCIWIDHLHESDPQLLHLLNNGIILTHPFIIGEMALGSLAHREAVLTSLRLLPQAPVATDEEVLEMVQLRQFFSRGIGYIDAHLIASLFLSSDIKFWTRDKRLAAIVREHHLLFEAAH